MTLKKLASELQCGVVVCASQYACRLVDMACRVQQIDAIVSHVGPPFSDQLVSKSPTEIYAGWPGAGR
jgi:hypothetical protein